MARKNSGDCAYCGGKDIVVTHDHVVPSGLWRKGFRPKKPVMVWACDPCHKRYDKHFDYFRANALMTADPKDQDVWSLLNEKVLPSVRRKAASRRMIDTIRSGKQVWVPNEKGILTERVSIKVDAAAHLLTILKMVKGFHHHYFDEVVEFDRVRITDTAIAGKDEREATVNALKTFPLKSIRHLGDGITTFCYRYCDLRQSNEHLDSMWAFRFLGGRVFFAIVLKTETANNEPATKPLSIPS